MLDDRKTQIDSNGSFTLLLSEHIFAEKVEYFDHLNILLENNQHYTSGRKVRVDMFYESFFISVFAYLEIMTGQVCDDFEAIIDNKICRSNLNERSNFEGMRKYLRTVVNIEFPTKSTLDKLIAYRKVRNVIAHGASLVSLKEKDEKTIEKLPGIRRDDINCLELTYEFYDEFLVFCEKYIEELKRIAGEIFYKYKNKVAVCNEM